MLPDYERRIAMEVRGIQEGGCTDPRREPRNPEPALDPHGTVPGPALAAMGVLMSVTAWVFYVSGAQVAGALIASLVGVAFGAASCANKGTLARMCGVLAVLASGVVLAMLAIRTLA